MNEGGGKVLKEKNKSNREKGVWERRWRDDGKALCSGERKEGG